MHDPRPDSYRAHARRQHVQTVASRPYDDSTPVSRIGTCTGAQVRQEDAAITTEVRIRLPTQIDTPGNPREYLTDAAARETPTALVCQICQLERCAVNNRRAAECSYNTTHV